MRGGVLVAAVSVSVLSAASSVTKVKETPVNYAGGPAPVWSGGSLIAIQNDRTSNVKIRLFDDNGVESALAFSLPGSPLIAIWSKARHIDGTLALSGLAVAGDGRRTPFLAIRGPNDKTWPVTATAPYNPNCIAFFSDGTVAAAGDEPGGTEYDVIRRFDKTGRQVAAYFPYSKLNSPAELIGGHLASGPDRVGWYTGEVVNAGATARYIEITESGEIQYFPAIPDTHPPAKWIDGLGITNDGHVYATTYLVRGAVSTLYTLDRATGTWQVVAMPPSAPGPFLPLVGTFGDKLVIYHKTKAGPALAFYFSQ